MKRRWISRQLPTWASMTINIPGDETAFALAPDIHVEQWLASPRGLNPGKSLSLKFIHCLTQGHCTICFQFDCGQFICASRTLVKQCDRYSKGMGLPAKAKT